MQPTRGYVFGPVYSRRLGWSLGVNNIPYKVCSYTCIYCQLGRTIRLTTERRRYSSPEELVREVAEALEKHRNVDYVSFVPDGEPTLDTALGTELRLIGELGARTAVLTNSSLLWIEDVRRDLSEASLVSLKIDAGDEQTWRAVDRPAPGLSFQKLLEGIYVFAEERPTDIITETMLVRGFNDDKASIEKIADIVARVEPRRAYILVPTRPPAEDWAMPPDEERLVEAHEVFRERGLDVELLTAPEPRAPRLRGDNPLEEVYATLAVHPLPEDVVAKLLEEAGIPAQEGLQALLGRGDVARIEYRGRMFLARRPRPAGLWRRKHG